MAQEYEITTYEAGDFRDPHGNYWCTIGIPGYGEPIKIVLKDPTKTKVGDKIYGEVKEQTSKMGKPYLRFYKATRPEGQNASGDDISSGWKDNSDGMRQGMCFNNATLFVNMMLADEKPNKPSPEEWAELVHAHAQALYMKGDLKAEGKTEAPVDKVFPVREEQPINLDDIPF